MKSLFATIKTIYAQDRRLILWAFGLAMLGMAIVIAAVVNLAPGVADGTIVRYSDSGGYEKGEWWEMLSFVLMGLALVVLHPMVAVRVYEKRGGSVAMAFLMISILIGLVVLMTLLRLVGEG